MAAAPQCFFFCRFRAANWISKVDDLVDHCWIKMMRMTSNRAGAGSRAMRGMRKPDQWGWRGHLLLSIWSLARAPTNLPCTNCTSAELCNATNLRTICTIYTGPAVAYTIPDQHKCNNTGPNCMFIGPVDHTDSLQSASSPRCTNQTAIHQLHQSLVTKPYNL